MLSASLGIAILTAGGIVIAGGLALTEVTGSRGHWQLIDSGWGELKAMKAACPVFIASRARALSSTPRPKTTI
jgi:hypothetical protein